MKYREEMWAKQAPDVYAGSECADIQPRWALDHGKGGVDHVSEIKLNPSHFPAGTKITISVPECPNCQVPADFNHDPNSGKTKNCLCGFDWPAWTFDEFS